MRPHYRSGHGDGAGGARGERTVTTLAALASYDQRPVPGLQAQVLDVRASSLGHPQPVEGEQRDQRVLGRRAEAGGDQERAELVAVQGGGVRLVVQPGTADVRGRGMVEEFLPDGVPVEPGDGTQPPGDSRAGPAEGFQFPGEGLDVRAADREQRQGPGAAPGSEVAQVEVVGLVGQAAVPGQCERLGIRERWLNGGERSRGDGGCHRGTSWDGWDPGSWAAGLSEERCPQRTPTAGDELIHDP
jgi:hypothetical protein